MSMSQIISSLNNKEEIQNNKSLHYQLRKLEDNILNNTMHIPSKSANSKQEPYSLLAFPFQKNDHQKNNRIYDE